MANPPKKKHQTNLRITDLARTLLERIGEKHGLNLTGALEYSIRATARAEGVWDIKAKSSKGDSHLSS